MAMIKTKLEKELFSKYVYYVRTNNIAPADVVAKFKADVEMVKNTDDYKKLNKKYEY